MNSNVPMKQQTKPGNSQVDHLFSTGLSVEERRPKGSYHLPITSGNSTHLHPTHSHLRYNLSYREQN
jgi:hypothetical protein